MTAASPQLFFPAPGMSGDNVVIAFPKMQINMAVSSVLRSNGINNPRFATSLSELMTVLAGTDAPVWVLSSFFQEKDQNLCRLLETLYKDPAKKQILVSGFFQEEELTKIPEAFSFGLFSCHQISFSIAYFAAEVKALFSEIEARQRATGSKVAVAGAYLRSFLKEIKADIELLNMETALYDSNPEDYRQLMKLAEVRFRLDDKEQAIKDLARATYFDPSLVETALSLQKKFVSDEEDASFAARNRIKNVCVVDSDQSSSTLIAAALKKHLGVIDCQTFTDAEAALAYYKTGEPDLILMEWKLPGLSGAVFVQRLRGEGYLNVPVVVVSSVPGKKDYRLMTECSISRVVPKPINAHELSAAVRWAIRQNRQPSTAVNIEEKIIAALKKADPKTARAFYSKLVETSGVAPARLLYCEGAISYYAKNYYAAQKQLTRALKLTGGKDVAVMALLSKALLEVGAFETAKILSERAVEVSPKNIERVCDHAALLYKIGKDSEAEGVFERAQALDQDNPFVLQIAARISLSKGDIPGASAMLLKLGSLEGVISYMNNKAISFSRSGDPEAGVNLYRGLLLSIPDKHDLFRRIVYYNMALSFIKVGDIPKAMIALRSTVKGSSPDFKGSSAHRKAVSLIKRLVKNKDGGVNLNHKFFDGGNDSVWIQHDIEAIFTKDRYEHLSGQDHCLGGIFIPVDQESYPGLLEKARIKDKPVVKLRAEELDFSMTTPAEGESSRPIDTVQAG